MKILVTGAAGFIGYHTARRLLERGDEVVGLDNLNAYYDPRLKDSRLKLLAEYPAFRFVKLDLADSERIGALFSSEQFHRVVHLAAQAGVRYSLTHPRRYIDSNIVGFLDILEGCRHGSVEHLVYASSSSVYGSNVVTPFSVRHNVDHPISMYAATKKANELMAHSYSHLFRIPTTGLRFFTVYGPWGRPDMALFLFTRAMLAGEPIDVFNHGEMQRDFTYIDDIVTGVVRVLDKAPVPNPSWDARVADPGSSSAPYKLYNIGNNNPVQLLDLIKTLEKALGLKAEMRMKEMQPGDVPATFADVDDLVKDVGFRPSTPIEVGVQRFVDWYREHYSNN
jgi:UDP-glucuronate 4-epimerase